MDLFEMHRNGSPNRLGRRDTVSFFVGELVLGVSCPALAMSDLILLLGDRVCHRPPSFLLEILIPSDVCSFSSIQEELDFVSKWPGRMALVLSLDSRKVVVSIAAVNIHALSAAIGHLLVVALSRRGGLLLHAAALKKGELVVVLAGPSGAGKSTLANNALDWKCLHDDKVALAPDDRGGWWASGVPLLDNKRQFGVFGSGDLDALYLLKKGAVLERQRVSAIGLLPDLAENVILPPSTPRVRKSALDAMLSLASSGRIWSLEFLSDSNIAELY